MTHNTSNTSNVSNNAIEPWQLTAYALNELEPDDAARVEQALELDSSLRAEFEQIQQTLSAVRSALAGSPTSVTLSEKQTVKIARHIEQVEASKPLASTVSVKLADRPFYRRKRFAALLVTAAAIPLAATYLPTLFDHGGPFAVHVPGETNVEETSVMSKELGEKKIEGVARRLESAPTVLPDSSENPERAAIVASSDAIGAGSGLIGDVDPSFVPEMGLVIIKGSKRDVERVQEVIDGIKDGKSTQSLSSLASSSEAKESSGFAAGPEVSGEAAVNAERRSKLNQNTITKNSGDSKDESSRQRGLGPKKTGEKQAGASNEGYEVSALEFGGGTAGGMGMDSGMASAPSTNKGMAMGGMGGAGRGYAGSGKGDSSGGGMMGSSRDGYGSGGPGYGGYPGGGGVGGLNVPGDMGGAGGMSPGGYGGGSAMGASDKSGPGMNPSRSSQAANGPISTARASNSLASEASPEPEVFARINLSETLATYDKRVRDEQLPEELRQNAPHLFNRAKIAESGTDRFEKIVETPFLETQKAPLSTFSIDVDTASYSKIRQTLMEGNRLPSPSMVRIEEMVNYFEYEYASPQDERPFAAHINIDRCPWNTEHQLVRIGLQAKKLDSQKRVKANIVFLLDVSGSMNEPNKLPLVKKALSMLVNQLTENDRVAIVVYAGAAGCVLPSITGAEKQTILSSLDHLNAGGSTNGGQGIQLAYSIAKEHFIPGGANRVVLCTDGDFNVGVTGDDALVAMMQENAKSNIFLTCLGFGAGNYNDSMMEKISNKGNGVYGMIDNELEARRMMVEQLGGTLVTVAKDVKIQVDFNPAKVAGYRLIGYEDRRLANKDFDDDKKDAGEIGAGHRVTALYEVIPAGKWVGVNPPSQGEASKYLQKPRAEPKFEAPAVAEEYSSEVLTLKVRYKEPEGIESTKQEFVLKETDRNDRPPMDRDMQWATSVAEFGLLLRRSEMAPHANWSDMLERATNSAGGDAYRLECLAMMRKARSMFP